LAYTSELPAQQQASRVTTATSVARTTGALTLPPKAFVPSYAFNSFPVTRDIVTIFEGDAWVGSNDGISVATNWVGIHLEIDLG